MLKCEGKKWFCPLKEGGFRKALPEIQMEFAPQTKREGAGTLTSKTMLYNCVWDALLAVNKWATDECSGTFRKVPPCFLISMNVLLASGCFKATISAFKKPDY